MERKSLEAIPLFQDLAPEHLELLATNFQCESFDANTVIFAQGDRAKKLYVLVSGKVGIEFKPHDGDLLTVAEIQEGGVFGWSAALGRSEYTSAAITRDESDTFSIKGDELHRLCEQYPETGVIILERLAGVIAERLQSTHTQVVKMLHEGVRSNSHS
jgi:CRP-like cAMP-binding protein